MSKCNAFLSEEKEFLVQLIKKYSVVKNKKTDATTIKKKAEAWNKICNEYNANSVNTKLEVVQLKRCWDKIKRRRKKDLAEERRERMKTGGEPTQPEKEVIPDVDTIVPHLTFKVENMFDSDAGPSTQYTIKTEITSEDENIENTFEECTIEDIAPSTNNKEISNRQTLFNKLMCSQFENTKFELECMKTRHEAEMKIFAMKLDIEKEKLKQEKLRTGALEMEIKNKKQD